MPEENYIWEAEFNDETPLLKQFDGGVENISKPVFEKDAAGKLSKLWLKPQDGTGNVFGVDLANGKLYEADQWKANDESDKGYAYHIIFFRRTQRSVSTVGEQVAFKMTFYIGWKAMKEGSEIKRVLKIQTNGEYVLQDNTNV